MNRGREGALRAQLIILASRLRAGVPQDPLGQLASTDDSVRKERSTRLAELTADTSRELIELVERFLPERR